MHQVGGLDDQILHAVGNSALQSLLHVVDLLAVTGLNMVDNDLCGEGAADRPVGICGLDGVLDALDVAARLSLKEVPKLTTRISLSPILSWLRASSLEASPVSRPK